MITNIQQVANTLVPLFIDMVDATEEERQVVWDGLNEDNRPVAQTLYQEFTILKSTCDMMREIVNEGAAVAMAFVDENGDGYQVNFHTYMYEDLTEEAL